MSKNTTKHELPHDLLSERSLIGCLLIDQMAFDQVIELQLIAEDFYDPKLSVVFTAIRELRFQSVVIDFVSVCSRLSDISKLEWIGGQSFVLDLIEDQASAANVLYYAKVVKDKSLLRQIIRSAVQVIENSATFSGSVQDYVSDVESSFFKLTSQFRLGGLRDIKTFLKLNLKDLENSDRKKGEIAGLPTGFIDLDRKLLGLQPGQLIVLAARPGVGKTSFGLSLAVNSSKASGLPIAIFSLEMLAPELSMRILSSEAGVDSMRLKTKNLMDTDLRNISKALKDLSQLPIFINDSADITLIDIKSQCRKIKAEQGLGLVMIDYLQLMNSHSKVLSREQQISEISRGLKNLAKELECPVIAMSQLNRAVESRQDRRPLISDLRESGSIEQDADIVCLIYRDDMYNQDSKDKGVAEIIVAKNRSGETGTVKLAWIGSQTKFASLHYDNAQEKQQHHHTVKAHPPSLPNHT